MALCFAVPLQLHAHKRASFTAIAVPAHHFALSTLGKVSEGEKFRCLMQSHVLCEEVVQDRSTAIASHAIKEKGLAGPGHN